MPALAARRIGAAVLTMAVLAPLDVTAAAASSAAAAKVEQAPRSQRYVPQGGIWAGRRAGVGPYRAGMPMTTPSRYGVRVWQELLNEHGATLPVTGSYGPRTADAVRRFQQANRLRVTGAVDHKTAKALLTRTIRREARNAGMPAAILCGHLWHESRLDPRSVGATGYDLGLAQVVRRYVPEMSAGDVWDEDASIRYMARRDAAAKKRYRRWDIALASYLSPVAAQRWFRQGLVARRSASYSRRALDGCGPMPTVRDIGRPSRSGKRADAGAGDVRQYRVRTGDSLWRIAIRVYGAAAAGRANDLAARIASANGVRGNVVRPGQVLQIPRR